MSKKNDDLAEEISARADKIVNEKLKKKGENHIDSASELSQKNDELLQDLQRTRAEFENYRKRVENDLRTAKATGEQNFAKKVLPLLDVFDAILSSETSDENLAKGLAVSQKKLSKTLSELKLEKLPVSLGDEFNHETMFAISVDESDGEREIVAEILQPGYLFDGALLRPAMVRIARK